MMFSWNKLITLLAYAYLLYANVIIILSLPNENDHFIIKYIIYVWTYTYIGICSK